MATGAAEHRRRESYLNVPGRQVLSVQVNKETYFFLVRFTGRSSKEKWPASRSMVFDRNSEPFKKRVIIGCGTPDSFPSSLADRPHSRIAFRSWSLIVMRKGFMTNPKKLY